MLKYTVCFFTVVSDFENKTVKHAENLQVSLDVELTSKQIFYIHITSQSLHLQNQQQISIRNVLKGKRR